MSGYMSGFSSNENHTLERTINIRESAIRRTQGIAYRYELDKCMAWIQENKLSQVCLQFPDSMLHDSADVILGIGERVGWQPCVLGDTQYGSCCVDMVSAKHIGADGIIHFGHACLSPIDGLPVLHIFEKLPIDTNDFVSSFREQFCDRTSKIILCYEVCYEHAIDTIVNNLSEDYPNMVVTVLASASNYSEKEKKVLGRGFSLPEDTKLEEFCLTFIGEDGLVLSNMSIALPVNSAYLYDPSRSKKFQPWSPSRSRFLRKRNYLIEQIKDANTLGILVGTLGVSHYLEAMDRIKKLAKRRGKKCYIISIGMINECKLANFPEVDVFVMLACYENSLVDFRDFLRPIVTPYEVELACNKNRTWSEHFVLEFPNLLPDGPDYQKMDDNISDDVGEVSLISGQVRVIHSADSNETSGVVAVRYGSHFLSESSWQGLEMNLGQDDPSLATVGRTGIPSSYDTDREAMDSSK